MNRRTVVLLVIAILSLTAVMVAGLAFWEKRRPVNATGTESSAPAEESTPYAPARRSNDAHGRLLFRVLPKGKPPVAYISYKSRIERYAVGDKLPPDQAVLASVADGAVVLQSATGEAVTLPLEDMPEEDRILFTEPPEIESIEDIPEPDFDDPEDRRKMAELTDPYASCAEIKDDERRRGCERKLAVELDQQTAACDEKDTKEEALKCYEDIERQFQSRPLAPDEQ